MSNCILSTSDNKSDYFTQFEDWYNYDKEMYQSTEYLARIARTSEQLSEAENEDEVERAIDEIIKYDPIAGYDEKGNPVYYIKVYEPSNKKQKKN